MAQGLCLHNGRSKDDFILWTSSRCQEGSQKVAKYFLSPLSKVSFLQCYHKPNPSSCSKWGSTGDEGGPRILAPGSSLQIPTYHIDQHQKEVRCINFALMPKWLWFKGTKVLFYIDADL